MSVRQQEVGFDAAILQVKALIEERRKRFVAIGHPAGINKARLLEELIEEIDQLQLPEKEKTK